MTTLDDLILYELPGCPFCAKVDAMKRAIKLLKQEIKKIEDEMED